MRSVDEYGVRDRLESRVALGSIKEYWRDNWTRGVLEGALTVDGLAAAVVGTAVGWSAGCTYWRQPVREVAIHPSLAVRPYFNPY